MEQPVRFHFQFHLSTLLALSFAIPTIVCMNVSRTGAWKDFGDDDIANSVSDWRWVPLNKCTHTTQYSYGFPFDIIRNGPEFGVGEWIFAAVVDGVVASAILMLSLRIGRFAGKSRAPTSFDT